MTGRNLITDVQNTWCPGCGNFTIQHTLKALLAEWEKEGRLLDNVVLVTGIGCHAKIADYLNINSFYSLHGRTIPVATGIKLANPDLTVICCCGDGDCYAEGLDHLVFAAKRNIDIAVLVHDNRVYGLTTGQYTPTSPLGFKGKSTPSGTAELPLNPLELMLACGATFIARGYTKKMDQLRTLIREGVMHKGFSFIDVLQICATFFPAADYYTPRVYEPADHDPTDFGKACLLAREWDYNSDARIALGVLYRKSMPGFGERIAVPIKTASEREQAVRDIIAARI
ncbi:thiamine pyrophosphate-dependent enzyme [Methanoregula formicica]|uniref:2-oxoacid:acceptor oxidoreductase, beta subunit, pyruvate/2-ketoisovalerate family n=1 Tax=Methanoregula formicica (strain DSM 22288 / NBRC 105244 / SMSP) TaxID=593750 RepID=L0HDF7_METFS|nr:thiamine pyrophosphate-dependent enzyme [Methanoregula formicica]AGB01821.1 2-oxoacid:acceptor oxidoreductase, beta subunit, pyruvate/2-ketoisovalerate family [Methanoregula formicica SMSP]